MVIDLNRCPHDYLAYLAHADELEEAGLDGSLVRWRGELMRGALELARRLASELYPPRHTLELPNGQKIPGKRTARLIMLCLPNGPRDGVPSPPWVCVQFRRQEVARTPFSSELEPDGAEKVCRRVAEHFRR